MSRFNPEKKLKSWESKYPLNKPRDLKFHITLEVPEHNGMTDTEKWDQLRQERREWLHGSRIRFHYMKKQVERTVDFEIEDPGLLASRMAIYGSSGGSGKSIFSMYSMYGVTLTTHDLWPNKWQDVYSFETEEHAVAFKLVFG